MIPLKIKGITLIPEDIIISYDVVGLFTSNAIDVFHQALHKDITLSSRTYLSCNRMSFTALVLGYTYFSYIGQLYQQCHGCPMVSPVSPNNSNLCMEQFKNIALTTYLFTGQ